MPNPVDHPPLKRVAYTDHAREAAERLLPGHDNPGLVAHDATRLPQFQQIQVASDQLHNHAESVRRGELFDFPGGFNGYAADALAHMDRLARTLEVAAAAARAHVEESASHTKGLLNAMKANKPGKDDPKLTTDGSPHPLQAGGYDPDKDAGLPGNISDVEALKEGKMTRAQAEAVARGDAELAGDKGPTPSDAATVTPNEKDAGVVKAAPAPAKPAPPASPAPKPAEAPKPGKADPKK